VEAALVAADMAGFTVLALLFPFIRVFASVVVVMGTIFLLRPWRLFPGYDEWLEEEQSRMVKTLLQLHQPCKTSPLDSGWTLTSVPISSAPSAAEDVLPPPASVDVDSVWAGAETLDGASDSAAISHQPFTVETP